MALSSLMADYQSNSEESDDGELSTNGSTTINYKDSRSSTAAGCSSGMDSVDCGADIQQSSAAARHKERLPNPLIDNDLPSPVFNRTTSDSSNCSSVFVSNYQLAEAAKQSVLERHVKLTTIDKATEESTSRDGRIIKPKVCQSFQRGCCRYGAKCRFKHDRSSSSGYQSHNVSRFQEGGGGAKWRITHWANPADLIDPELDKNDYDGNVSTSKKHKCGILDSLVPPKRAMSTLAKFREQERPWTVDK